MIYWLTSGWLKLRSTVMPEATRRSRGSDESGPPLASPKMHVGSPSSTPWRQPADEALKPRDPQPSCICGSEIAARGAGASPLNNNHSNC
eukprot:7900901-Pyramimonas_sp.AAC.1